MIPQMLNGLARHEAEHRAEQLLDDGWATGPPVAQAGNLVRGRTAACCYCAGRWRMRPCVLLADEPTGNLDPETADEVFTHLRQIVRGTGAAALIVTHNEKLAATMDRCLTIRDGAIVEL